MKKKIFLFVLGIIICFFFYHQIQPEDFRQKADRIALQKAKELSKKYDMHILGFGGGMMFDIEKIIFDFKINRLISKNEARTILIDCLETLTDAFNENKEIRPFLHNYPFNVNNVDIGIFPRNAKDKQPGERYLAWVFNRNDTIYFGNKDLINPYNVFEDTEPYEEALKIVANQKTNPNS